MNIDLSRAKVEDFVPIVPNMIKECKDRCGDSQLEVELQQAELLKKTEAELKTLAVEKKVAQAEIDKPLNGHRMKTKKLIRKILSEGKGIVRREIHHSVQLSVV